MNITVIGATGATGREMLARLALTRHHVTVLARRPAAVPAGQWRVAEGDATDEVAVVAAVSGADAVITLVGAPAGAAPGTVRSASTKVLVDAVRAASPQPHLLVVSAVGGDASIGQLSWFGRTVYRRVVGVDRLAEVTLSEQIIATAQVPTTLVRAPKLDDRPATGFRVATKPIAASAVLHRADLADYLVHALANKPAGVNAATVVSATGPAPL